MFSSLEDDLETKAILRDDEDLLQNLTANNEK